MTNWVRERPAESAVGEETRVECSRLDTRLMGRPEKFKQDAMWLDWKFQIEAYVGFLGCFEPLQAAELGMNYVTMITLTTDT